EAAAGPCGKPPVPAAHQRDHGGDDESSDHRRVEQDADRERGGEHLLVAAAVGNRDCFDDCGAAATPVQRVGCCSTVDAVDALDLLRDPLWLGLAVNEDLVWKESAFADPGVLERDEALLGVARLGKGVGVMDAEPKA